MRMRDPKEIDWRFSEIALQRFEEMRVPARADALQFGQGQYVGWRAGVLAFWSSPRARWLTAIVLLALALRVGWVLYATRAPQQLHDPLFYLLDENATLAELPAARKNQISHRALAAKAARKVLERWVAEGTI